MQELWAGVNWLLGVDVSPGDMNSLQMALRAIVIYGGAIVLVRVGDQRHLGRLSVVDIILAVILGSTFSRAINGSAALIPTLAAGATLLGVHWLLAALAVRSARLDALIKGQAHTLVHNGEPLRDALRRHNISDADLMEAVYYHGKINSLAQVKEARLERRGEITIIHHE